MSVRPDMMIETETGRKSVCLETCERRIEQVRDRWRLLHRMLGLSALVGSVAVLTTLAIVLDYHVRGAGPWRACLTLGVVIIGCVVLIQWVLPCWRGISVDRAALLLERLHPDLRGRLVTAVQPQRDRFLETSGASESLHAEVCAEAERRAIHLSPALTVPAGPIIRRAAPYWVVAAIVLALACALPATTARGLARVYQPWRTVSWPQRTRIVMSDPGSDQPMQVVRGGAAVLSGRAEGEVPSRGTIHIEIAGRPVDRLHFDINANGHFEIHYRPVKTDLVASIEIGDAQAGPFEVLAVPPPEISSLRTECIYPEYTHLGSKRFEDGNVQAVLGTEVRIMVETSKPVERATIEWDNGAREPMYLSEDRSAGVRTHLTASRSYRVHLTDALGFTNDDPVQYRLEMIDNAYPKIEKVTPATDKRVTPEAVLPLSIEVTDDFGVKSVAICYRRDDADTVDRIALPVGQVRKRLDMTYDWPLRELNLEPGQTLSYCVEARDEGEHAEQRDWPQSRWRRLSVLTEPQLARSLSEQLERILDQLAELDDIQSESAESIRQAAGGDINEPSERTAALQRARSEKWRQDWLARQAARIAEQLISVAEDYEISRIGQADRRARLWETARALAQLAGEGMPEATLELTEALSWLEEMAAPEPNEREEP